MLGDDCPNWRDPRPHMASFRYIIILHVYAHKSRLLGIDKLVKRGKYLYAFDYFHRNSSRVVRRRRRSTREHGPESVLVWKVGIPIGTCPSKRSALRVLAPIATRP